MKTTMAVQGLLVLFLAHGVAAWGQQVCPAGYPHTTPDADFRDTGGGTVLHVSTGLVWKRCAEGQTWSGGACTGTPTLYNWQDALAQAEGSTYAGQSDWRLPNIKELESLVEDGCYNPAINAIQFPDTPAGNFWSGSPLVAQDSNSTWFVNFNYGDDNWDLRDFAYVVRLVRAGQSFSSCSDSGICPGAVSSDLNWDGRSDILWHNGATAGNTVWLLNVTTDAAIAPVGLTAPVVKMADVTWHIACMADFDGDGKSDLLWRHGNPGETVTSLVGANQVWFMYGATRLAVRNINAQADLAWQVAGCRDFDGDGKSDILWRHASSGADTVWLMNVTADPALRVLKSAKAITAMPDLTWHVAGVADFNGDGKADILWRHGNPGEIANGANQVWLMDGTTRAGVRNINTLADLDWQVAGMADYDGDSKADVVWRHGVSGLDRIWLLDVTTNPAVLPLKSTKNIPTMADPTWHIVGTGDYNGDGKADLLWRHGRPGETVPSAIGANQVWLMNGFTRLGVRTINAIADLNWQPTR
jgi:hypothetical protein